MRKLLTLLSDWLLERRIRRERIAVCAAKTTADAREHAAHMRDLIAMRSSGQVSRMERRKGLI